MTTPQPAAQRVAERAAAVAARLETAHRRRDREHELPRLPLLRRARRALRRRRRRAARRRTAACRCWARCRWSPPCARAATRPAGGRERARLARGTGHPRHRRAHPRHAGAGPGGPHPPPADRPLAGQSPEAALGGASGSRSVLAHSRCVPIDARRRAHQHRPQEPGVERVEVRQAERHEPRAPALAAAAREAAEHGVGERQQVHDGQRRRASARATPDRARRGRRRPRSRRPTTACQTGISR